MGVAEDLEIETVPERRPDYRAKGAVNNDQYQQKYGTVMSYSFHIYHRCV